MKYFYNGYHGTNVSAGEDIIKCQYFKPSYGEDEWLGEGYYFFNNSEFYAIWWARDYKEYEEYIILKAPIQVEEENLLDLSQEPGLKQLDEWAKMLRQKRLSSKKYAKKEINDNLVINYIYNNIVKFHVVIGIFPFDNKKYCTRFKALESYGSRLKAYQIQICVREKSCIGKIEEDYRE